MAIDETEHQRRQQQRLGAVTELPILHSLSELPHGLPVFFDALARRDQERLVRAPYSMVDFVADGVVREVRPAADVVGVRVSTGAWTSRLRRAAEFARFAPTMAVLRRPPTPEQELQADYFGVGLVQQGQPEQVYLEAKPPAVSFAPVQWLFREHAYRAWLGERGPAAQQRRALVDLLDSAHAVLTDEQDLHAAGESPEDDVAVAQAAYDAAFEALEACEAIHAEPAIDHATCVDEDTDEL